MFGYVKKESVEAMLEKEVELNRKMFEKYSDLLNSHNDIAGDGECYKREQQRLSQLSDEYFARYQESKELLDKVKRM